MLKQISQEFHMPIHFLIGVSIGILFNIFSETKLSLFYLIFLGLLSLLPDLEHLIFMFGYGSKTDYAKKAVGFLKKYDLLGFSKFCKINHKFNTSLYLHNALLPLVLLVLAGFYIDRSAISSILFTLASHYVFDIFEDLLILGKINTNWFLKFNTTKSR